MLVWPQVISFPSPESPTLNSRLSHRVQVITHASPAFWWTGLVVSNLPASIFRPLATFLLLRSIQHCNFPQQTSDRVRKGGRQMWITPPCQCVMQGQKHKSNLATNFLRHNPSVINKCLNFPFSFFLLKRFASMHVMLHNVYTYSTLHNFSPLWTFTYFVVLNSETKMDLTPIICHECIWDSP